MSEKTPILTASCNDVKELQAVAKSFASHLQPGDIVFLNGPLGAGKTTFVAATGQALGIKKVINSPTFNIICEYENKICHIDGYRLVGEQIELDYYLNGEYIIFIEWSENITHLIKPKFIIDIDYTPTGGRSVEIKG